MIVKNPAARAVFRTDRMAKTDLLAGDHLFAGLNCFEPGQEHEPHAHCDRDKLYLVLEGTGEATIGGEPARIAAGDMALARAGVEHSLRNLGPGRLVVAAIFGPPPAGSRGSRDRSSEVPG